VHMPLSLHRGSRTSSLFRQSRSSGRTRPGQPLGHLRGSTFFPRQSRRTCGCVHELSPPRSSGCLPGLRLLPLEGAQPAGTVQPAWPQGSLPPPVHRLSRGVRKRPDRLHGMPQDAPQLVPGPALADSPSPSSQPITPEVLAQASSPSPLSFIGFFILDTKPATV